MGRQPQNDLRYQKTEALIHKNFCEMLGEMEYAQITVKELTQRAQMNRKTFYLHYPTLDDLLVKKQSELINRFSQALMDTRLPDDLERIVRHFFQFFTGCSQTERRILCSRGHFSAGKSLIVIENEQCYQCNAFLARYNAFEKKMLGAFLTGTLCQMYTQWVEEPSGVSLEDAVQFTTKLISRGLHGEGSA